MVAYHLGGHLGMECVGVGTWHSRGFVGRKAEDQVEHLIIYRSPQNIVDCDSFDRDATPLNASERYGIIETRTFPSRIHPIEAGKHKV